MRRIEHKKYYVQISDVLMMDYIEDDLPESLLKKAFNVKKPLFIEDEKEYFEIDETEMQYISKKEYIYNKNFLNILSYDQLVELFKTLKKEYTRINKYEIDKESKELNIINHKYSQILEYLNERLTPSCETCTNSKCIRTDEDKMGLNPNGKPMGSECGIYKNILSRDTYFNY